MTPFDKPKHVGYCLSCYDDTGHRYSIPIDASTADLRLALGREYPINAEPLSSEEFRKVFAFVIGAIEQNWYKDFEFYVEGMNLPVDWE